MPVFKKALTVIAAVIVISQAVKAQDHRFDPPWNTPPESPVAFTVPGIDNIPDLFGDINDPQLVIFFAGNQFMCVDDLLAAFKAKHPQYQRIFVETLPPGILAQQMEKGGLTIGNMRINLKPDVFTDGKNGMDRLTDKFTRTEPYAYNTLSIMVQKGNPKNIKSVNDLQRNDVRVSMPNPAWEGIGKQIEAAYVKAGGEALRKSIMEDKVSAKTTYLTKIHHRETPMRVLYDQSDAGPVWFSEVFYQKMINHPVELVEIPADKNITATYVAGLVKNAPHPQAAKDFMDFLISAEAKAVYKKYGFITK